MPSTSRPTKNRLTKAYNPAVDTASTSCWLLVRNCFILLKTWSGTKTDRVTKSVKSIVAWSSGVSELTGLSESRKGGVRRISRSCGVVSPTERATGSC